MEPTVQENHSEVDSQGDSMDARRTRVWKLRPGWRDVEDVGLPRRSPDDRGASEFATTGGANRGEETVCDQNAGSRNPMEETSPETIVG